jgi:hypothetical protein
MKLILFIFATHFFLPVNYTESNSRKRTTAIELPGKILFEKIKTTYDTLIPIFDGLFVTYDSIDRSHYINIANKIKKDTLMAFFSGDLVTSATRKWGVIDSAGNIIVPFICDGARAISGNKGVVSVYSHSFSLNTGIPRYMYFGNYFFFTKKGLLNETRQNFSLKIVFIADWHHSEFVIRQGPEFYLPNEFRKEKRAAR